MNKINSNKSIAEYIANSVSVLSNNNIEIDKSRIDNIIDKKRNPQFVISILGSMKSGKSTFVNALIGNDLMPSENEACTLTTTEIVHKKCDDIEIIKEYVSGNKERIQGDNLSKAFHEEVKLSRKSKDKGKFKYKVNHTIKTVSELNSKIEFSIVDTPGYNEMNGLGVDRKIIEEIFDDQLKKTNYIIYVFDYKYYKAQENVDILERIKKVRPDIIKNNNISFVINKIDLISYKDGNINEVINDVKKMINSLGINDYNIFNLSAKKALISRLIENNKNLDMYKEEIEELRPIIQKEIDGELLDIKTPINSLPSILLKESNIEIFEEEIIKSLFLNSENKVISSINDMENEVSKELKIRIDSVINKYKDEAKVYYEKQKLVEENKKLILESTNKFNTCKNEIIKLVKIPSYDEAKKTDFYKVNSIWDDYVYPKSEYDEYYSSDSSAMSAAKRKFNSWKNSIKIDLELNEIYSIYNSKLQFNDTSGNYYNNINLKVSSELRKLSDLIEQLEKKFNKFSGKKIISHINIMPDAIMSLSYDNSRCYLSDIYDNSKFIDIDYETKYVSGFFGMKEKTVTTYDISDAMRNEKEDILSALNSCSNDFFNDYYNKKYEKYLTRVKDTAQNEVEKAADIINDLHKFVNSSLNKNEINKLNKLNEDIKSLEKIKCNI